ncbi:MAG: adenylate/guanylate cyclase domain-containing response regulator [Deltaproteobacteria bacterium]|nr:MAG: adenylate/guanylate cyclase domain-containing response regulator [Deltaproteobacteria bacterium]
MKALSSAETDPPDLVLLDVIMPRLDGLEVLHVLKQRPQTADVPVLLLTIDRSEEITLRGLWAGADDVIQKPVNNELLLAKVEAALQRKKKIDQLKGIIRRHLDPSIAYKVLHQPENTLSLVRTHLAVLFTDLRGFTEVSEQLDPEQTANLLNRLFEELVRCVLRYGGTLDKFLGDGLMALFGAPVSYPDNETRAVCAALEMVQTLEQLDSETDQNLDMGIGISSGEVVVGPLGSSMRANYTAIGDTVNVAARLTALASGRQIIISEAVAKRLDSQVKVEKLPPAKLKGKRNPLQIYRVLPGQKLDIVMRRKT